MSEMTMPPQGTQPEKQASIWSLIVTGILVLSVVFLVRIYIAKPFIVSGLSMYPTFDSWHYLIIDEFSYNFLREPVRGEVVVFHYPANPGRHFIKRVIGMPGETVHMNGTAVTITTTDGEALTLDEPYVQTNHEKTEHFTVTLHDDEYFVMGDNRADSADSRFFGPLGREYIVGRAFVRLFPFTAIDYLPGEAAYTTSDNAAR